MTWHEEVRDRIVTNFGTKQPFTIDDVYEWESELKDIYPDNRHVRETFRDIMQDFRDEGWIRFKDFEGTYEILRDRDPSSSDKSQRRATRRTDPERNAPQTGT